MVANTGDDCEMYGVHVSPDPDLVTYWLADAIGEHGYGIRGDTFRHMEELTAAGVDTWFRLGDRDLEMCRLRTGALAGGERLTRAHARVVEAMGVRAQVLPMADEPVRTRVLAGGRWLPFQEYMILQRAALPVEGVEFAGASSAGPSPEVAGALRAADVVVIGPSNPVASIGPILALRGMRDALLDTAAPVLAVSPFVRGRSVKGPTDLFCAHAGIAPSAEGIAAHYGDMIDAVVSDERVDSVPSARIETDMDAPGGRARVADAVLALAQRIR